MRFLLHQNKINKNINFFHGAEVENLRKTNFLLLSVEMGGGGEVAGGGVRLGK